MTGLRSHHLRLHVGAHRALRDEVASMRGRDAFSSFYSKLGQSREYHQKFPDLVVQHHVSPPPPPPPPWSRDFRLCVT
jgi:hypothetical protein